MLRGVYFDATQAVSGSPRDEIKYRNHELILNRYQYSVPHHCTEHDGPEI